MNHLTNKITYSLYEYSFVYYSMNKYYINILSRNNNIFEHF